MTAQTGTLHLYDPFYAIPKPYGVRHLLQCSRLAAALCFGLAAFALLVKMRVKVRLICAGWHFLDVVKGAMGEDSRH